MSGGQKTPKKGNNPNTMWLLFLERGISLKHLADDSGKVAWSAAETSLFKKSLKTPIFNPSHPAYFL